MSNLIVYYAHPGQKHSNVNRYMFAEAKNVHGITLVDLYAEYPRFEIDVDKEQQRLLAHDVILFQFPLFWYSTPSLIKEWLDLVLELGFAYGAGGDALTNKRLMLAVSAAGPEDAYTPSGYQRYPLRTFLTPMERTAGLCHMTFTPPYVLYEALQAPNQGLVTPHTNGYRRLLEAVRDDRFDFDAISGHDVMTFNTLPIEAINDQDAMKFDTLPIEAINDQDVMTFDTPSIEEINDQDAMKFDTPSIEEINDQDAMKFDTPSIEEDV